jgi:hypothetical protein
VRNRRRHRMACENPIELHVDTLHVVDPKTQVFNV